MVKIQEKYEKGKVPAGLETFYTVEKDGFMFAEFDESIALATNPALAANNAKLLKEKGTVQQQYDDLVTSTANISKELNQLKVDMASGNKITTDQLAIVTALKDIDGTPDEIKEKLTKFDALQAEISQLKTQDQNREIAQIMGWKPSVFGDLRNHPEKGKDLDFEIETVTENGQPVKKVHVKTKNADGTVEKKDFKTFIEGTPAWNEYLPSLQATPQETGPNWLPQGPLDKGSKAPKNPMDAHIEAQNKKAIEGGSAFRPPKPAAQGAPAT